MTIYIGEDFYNTRLSGELNLNEFTNLQKLDLINPEITTLKLNNCLKLWHLSLSQADNLSNLELSSQAPLRFIHLGGCQITSLDLSAYKCLTRLFLISLPKLTDLVGLEKLPLTELNIKGCGFNLDYLTPIVFLNK